MDRDYFQYVEDASSSAMRIASRTIALAAYGMIGVYALSVTFQGIVPAVMSNVLPLVNDEDSSMDMMANGSHQMIFHNHGDL